MEYAVYFLIFVCSFLIGSIPNGYIIARAHGVDIRKVGSGNIGATNIYRALGRKAGFLTLFLDVAKGFVAVFIFCLVFEALKWCYVVASIGAVLGHDFSVFLGFKGGKGVATTYGVTVFIAPYVALLGMSIWILILVTTRYSSVAALSSFLIVALVAVAVKKPDIYVLVLFFYALMLFTHRENLRRIFTRTENKLKL